MSHTWGDRGEDRICVHINTAVMAMGPPLGHPQLAVRL